MLLEHLRKSWRCGCVMLSTHVDNALLYRSFRSNSLSLQKRLAKPLETFLLGQVSQGLLRRVKGLGIAKTCPESGIKGQARLGPTKPDAFSKILVLLVLATNSFVFTHVHMYTCIEIHIYQWMRQNVLTPYGTVFAKPGP